MMMPNPQKMLSFNLQDGIVEVVLRFVSLVLLDTIVLLAPLHHCPVSLESGALNKCV